MEFIELGNDRYLIKDSNNVIVSKKDIIEDKSPKTKTKGCKDCEIKIDKKGELKIDNEKSIKLDDNK